MATKINIKDPNPGAWFDFDETDPETGRISIRPVNMAKRREISKKTVKTKVEYKKNNRFEFQETNDDLFSEMLWDYVIADWERLEDDDGQPIPCTKENKVKLMQENIAFATFVNDCMERVSEEIESRLTAQKKTSSSEPSEEETSLLVSDAEN